MNNEFKLCNYCDGIWIQKNDSLCRECFEEIMEEEYLEQLLLEVNELDMAELAMEERHKKTVNIFEHHYLTDNLTDTEIDDLYIENTNLYD
ncbi:hypothetical protein ABID56_001024 [Alkalibacillus flavidus]|uniref:Uncharacterized protein n=1 Tax=Alkalibacillus flavidus TaxID=546021 RepID=A0ABV2KTN3_9BACI